MQERHEGANDRQRERDAQGHPRALARLAVDFDNSADPLDVRADHVHANAAAGDRRHFLRRRQARFEDQRQLLARRELRRVVHFEQADIERLGDELLAVDHQRVAGVRTTAVTNDGMRALGKEVDNLALTFIAPLGADDDDDRHLR